MAADPHATGDPGADPDSAEKPSSPDERCRSARTDCQRQRVHWGRDVPEPPERRSLEPGWDRAGRRPERESKLGAIAVPAHPLRGWPGIVPGRGRRPRRNVLGVYLRRGPASNGQRPAWRIAEQDTCLPGWSLRRNDLVRDDEQLFRLRAVETAVVEQTGADMNRITTLAERDGLGGGARAMPSGRR